MIRPDDLQSTVERLTLFGRPASAAVRIACAADPHHCSEFMSPSHAAAGAGTAAGAAAGGQEPHQGTATARSLQSVAEQRGSCTAGATEAELQALLDSLRSSEQEGGAAVGAAALQVQQPAVPPSLAALWCEAGEWHFSHSHYNVFGCNLFAPASVVQSTEQIFGDWDCRADWRAGLAGRQPEQPSVADPGWLCVASFSEYDFLFCCFDSASPHFGHIRHMVNNCGEENPCWNDIIVLADKLLAWHAAGGDSEEDGDEASTLSQMLWAETRPGRGGGS